MATSKKDPKWVTKICSMSEDLVSLETHEKFLSPKYYGFYMAWGYIHRNYDGLYLCVSSNGDWVCSQVVETSEMGIDFLKVAIEYLKKNDLYTGK